MLIKNFYIIPENITEEKFADDNIKFLLKLFFRKIKEVKDEEEYKKVVTEKFKNWLEEKGFDCE